MTSQETTVPERQGAPAGLLQQMEALMAVLNADLSQLDADLQQPPGPPLPQSPDASLPQYPDASLPQYPEAWRPGRAGA
ncbi:hypothetical protein [Streptomyces sp. NPDC050264]|uniref:hypothetical protein n=1 Tax=Streptomyces sp. NPDC050264 TaxID=3155038 RepID=UPI003426B7F6